MKGLFPQYGYLSEEDYKVAWEQATFVFDTNVLLNFYRYGENTRNELLDVLNKFSNRIWVSHHVALEFQRNRLKVIAEQTRGFTKVHNVVKEAQSKLDIELAELAKTKRHFVIESIEPLFNEFKELADHFLNKLDQVKEKQQKLTAPDPLKEKIEELFDKKVGAPPESQKAIDDLYKEAEERFKYKIPPGYEDTGKVDSHRQGGITYKQKYGDYLIWKQLLDHAKTSSWKHIILITDDDKEDWWNLINSGGTKTIGPRPELVEEAHLVAGIETFLMYKSDGFLKYAKKFLEEPVSKEILEEVRDVSNSNKSGLMPRLRKQSSLLSGNPNERIIDRVLKNNLLRHMELRETHEKIFLTKKAVALWLESHFESVHEAHGGFADLIAERDGKLFGFTIIYVSDPYADIHKIHKLINQANDTVKEENISELAIVCAVDKSLGTIEAWKMAALLREEDLVNMRIIIGNLDISETGMATFISDYSWFSPNRARI